GERAAALPVSFGAGAGPADASAASGDRPRNTRVPSDVAASSDTRPGWSPGTPPPKAAPCAGSGSQINVTRVLPFSPRSVPIHVRTYLPDCTDGAIDASAVCTGLATSETGLLIFSTSAAVSAQYPLRARTSTPLRLTLTVIGWNLPSFPVFVE